MRETRAMRSGLTAVLFSLTSVSSAHAAGEVNMSRYQLSAVMPAQVSATAVYVLQAVDVPVVAAFCEDGDGCTLRVRMTGAAGFRAGQRTLFKAGTDWMTTDPGGSVSGIDLDLDATDVVLIGPGNGNFCAISDLDSIDTGDDSAGFSLIAYFSGSGGSTPGFTCLLTLID